MNSSEDEDVVDPSFFPEDDPDQYQDGEDDIPFDPSVGLYRAPSEAAKQAIDDCNSFESNLLGVIGPGLDWDIPGFERVLVTVNSLRKWVKASFDRLPPWIQSNIGLAVSGHAVLVYDTKDVLLVCLEIDPNFQADQIPLLTLDELRAAKEKGLRPILKALSKEKAHEVIGGSKTHSTLWTSTNLSFFRNRHFSCMRHNEEFEEFEDIEVCPDSVAKLKNAKALAEEEWRTFENAAPRKMS